MSGHFKGMIAAALDQFDQTMAAWKALAGARSLKEAIDLRANLPLVSFEKALAETGKIADTSLKLAEEVMAPLATRIAAAPEQVKVQ